MKISSFTQCLKESPLLRLCFIALLHEAARRVCILVTKVGKKHLVFRVATLPLKCRLDSLPKAQKTNRILLETVRHWFKSARVFSKRVDAIDAALVKLRERFGSEVSSSWIRWLDMRHIRFSLR